MQDNQSNVKKELIHHFESMELKESIYNALKQYGFKRPKNLQQYAIPQIIKNKYCVVSGPTESGKKLISIIGALSHVDPDKQSLQLVIVTSHQKKANDYYHQFLKLSIHSGVTIIPLTSQTTKQQKRILRQGRAQIIICPLYYIFTQRVRLEDVGLVCMIEFHLHFAKGGFQSVRKFLQKCSIDVGIHIFSQVWERQIEVFIADYMKEPSIIKDQRTKKVKLDNITHLSIETDGDSQKLSIIDCLQIDSAIIFVKNRQKTLPIMQRLRQRKFKVETVQNYQKLMEKNDYKTWKILQKCIILCIDDEHPYSTYQGINPKLVINYDMPENVQIYLKKSGNDNQIIQFWNRRERKIVNLALPSDKKLFDQLWLDHNISVQSLPFF